VTEKTGKVCFDNTAKEKLIELFPEDKTLQAVYDLHKKQRVIQQLDKLLIYADGDRLYPNYNLLAAATERFRVAKPEVP
jgi:hypothetical protein